MHAVNVPDYRSLAQSKLAKNIFDFIDSGACDEITKRKNKKAFAAINLIPLCLRNVSQCSAKIQLLNQEIHFPLLIAPTAFHQLVDKNGENSTAKAAKAVKVPMVVSCMANKSLEDIAATSEHPNLWLQVYIFKNRSLTEQLIRRAEKAQYKALLITVGVPISGKRERDLRNQFKLPAELSTANFVSTMNKELIYNFTAQELDDSITWDDIHWLQSLTSLPIILKGILNPLDAEQACQLNVAGIVVSNHGGRQLDTAITSIDALPAIAHQVKGRTQILLDGGVERGTDILKAIALGADAVLIGRPILWALAVQGELGVQNLLTMLSSEFENAMKLIGCQSIQEIKDLGPYICQLKS